MESSRKSVEGAAVPASAAHSGREVSGRTYSLRTQHEETCNRAKLLAMGEPAVIINPATNVAGLTASIMARASLLLHHLALWREVPEDDGPDATQLADALFPIADELQWLVTILSEKVEDQGGLQ